MILFCVKLQSTKNYHQNDQIVRDSFYRYEYVEIACLIRTCLHKLLLHKMGRVIGKCVFGHMQ